MLKYKKEKRLLLCQLAVPYLDELDVVLVGALGWGCVEAAGGELVAGLLDHVPVVEVSQHGEQGAAVPVVCHTTSVVALTCQVADRVKRHLVILIDEHLKHVTGGLTDYSVCVCVCCACVLACASCGVCVYDSGG